MPARLRAEVGRDVFALQDVDVDHQVDRVHPVGQRLHARGPARRVCKFRGQNAVDARAGEVFVLLRAAAVPIAEEDLPGRQRARHAAEVPAPVPHRLPGDRRERHRDEAQVGPLRLLHDDVVAVGVHPDEADLLFRPERLLQAAEHRRREGAVARRRQDAVPRRGRPAAGFGEVQRDRLVRRKRRVRRAGNLLHGIRNPGFTVRALFAVQVDRPARAGKRAALRNRARMVLPAHMPRRVQIRVLEHGETPRIAFGFLHDTFPFPEAKQRRCKTQHRRAFIFSAPQRSAAEARRIPRRAGPCTAQAGRPAAGGSRKRPCRTRP